MNICNKGPSTNHHVDQLGELCGLKPIVQWREEVKNIKKLMHMVWRWPLIAYVCSVVDLSVILRLTRLNWSHKTWCDFNIDYNNDKKDSDWYLHFQLNVLSYMDNILCQTYFHNQELTITTKLTFFLERSKM